MDLLKFRKSCGDCTDEELVKAVWEIDQTVQLPDQARAWIWMLIKRLLKTDRYALEGVFLWCEAAFKHGQKKVKKHLRCVGNTSRARKDVYPDLFLPS
jgi:hypothetical protein